MKITVYPSLTAVASPQVKEVTWQTLVTDYLSKHEVLSDKSKGRLFGFYEVTNSRKDSNVTAIFGAVFDADACHCSSIYGPGDDGLPPCVLKTSEKLCHTGLAATWHTSHSHTPNHHAFHLIIPFAEPLDPALWPQVRVNLLRIFDIQADVTKCSGISHAYYLPSVHPDRKPLVHTLDGFPLDPLQYATDAPPITVDMSNWEPPEDCDVQLRSLERRIRRRLERLPPGKKADYLGRCLRGEPLAQHGDRNSAACITAGMIAYTLHDQPVEAIYRLMERSVQTMIAEGSSLTEGEVKRMIRTSLKNKAREDREAEAIATAVFKSKSRKSILPGVVDLPPKGDATDEDPNDRAEDEDPGAPLPLPQDFAYYLPAEAFIQRTATGWDTDAPFSRQTLSVMLRKRGYSAEDVKAFFAAAAYPMIWGKDLQPNADELFTGPNGETYINTWVKPTIVPAPNPWPTIRRVINHLTDGDSVGATWLIHWIARKIQNPQLVPKTAVVLVGHPGSGKGFLSSVLMEMLGRKNCASIQRDQIESRYNEDWIGKLFILADEVAENDRRKEVSAQLKVYLDSATLWSEAKFQQPRRVPNRSQWIFASNDKVLPVVVEPGDRRYTVFSNFTPVAEEYRNTMNACFEADRTTPTQVFRQEIAGFMHHCLELQVDPFAFQTYANEARNELITASKNSFEAFFDDVKEEGLLPFLDRALHAGSASDVNQLEHWDLSDGGIQTKALYACYRQYCKDHGVAPSGEKRFSRALTTAAGWKKERRYCKATGKQTRCVLGVPLGPSPVKQAEVQTFTQPTADA